MNTKLAFISTMILLSTVLALVFAWMSYTTPPPPKPDNSSCVYDNGLREWRCAPTNINAGGVGFGFLSLLCVGCAYGLAFYWLSGRAEA